MNSRSARAILSTTVWIVAGWTVVAAPAAAAIVAADASAARTALRSATFGDAIELAGVGDLLTGERMDLELRAFDVWAPGGTVRVHGDFGVEILPPPPSRYFRGAVVGRAGSQVMVVVHGDGSVRGLLRDGAGLTILGQASVEARAAGRLEARRVDSIELDARRPFSCEIGALGSSAGRAPALPAALAGAASSIASTAQLAPAYSARYGVETDFEFYGLFGNTTAATEYITDLMGFISILYDDEINTTIALGTINLRTSAADPWTQTSTLCALFEYGRYWNDNYTGGGGNIVRDAAVMLSGKDNGGGVAWLGVLCDSEFSVNHGNACPALTPQTDNYGGDFAYVGTIDGDFDIWDPGVIWDVVATAHELGHNFNSQHTHCYSGEAGNPSQVDACYSRECPAPDQFGACPAGSNPCTGSGGSAKYSNGCFCPDGSHALPSSGSTSGGSAGQGGGTIMSYCHLRTGGFGNISLNFGTGHSFGVAASRVATKMSSYVAATAPPAGCLDYTAGSHVFLDGFETGSTGRWGGSQP